MQQMQESQVQSLGWGDPLQKEVVTYSSNPAWKTHGQRTLVGCSTWGCKESDMTERLSTAVNHLALDF